MNLYLGLLPYCLAKKWLAHFLVKKRVGPKREKNVLLYLKDALFCIARQTRKRSKVPTDDKRRRDLWQIVINGTRSVNTCICMGNAAIMLI